MKIVMITGSAHKNGTTAKLAEEFSKGAREAGHEVYRFSPERKLIMYILARIHSSKGLLGCV